MTTPTTPSNSAPQPGWTGAEAAGFALAVLAAIVLAANLGLRSTLRPTLRHLLEHVAGPGWTATAAVLTVAGLVVTLREMHRRTRPADETGS